MNDSQRITTECGNKIAELLGLKLLLDGEHYDTQNGPVTPIGLYSAMKVYVDGAETQMPQPRPKTYDICPEDCKTVRYEGYLHDVWDGLCSAFGLDPAVTTQIEVCHQSHETA